jgi:hypothetical protein
VAVLGACDLSSESGAAMSEPGYPDALHAWCQDADMAEQDIEGSGASL